MDVRQALTVVGAGISTFLLAAVLVIELLDVEFSAIVGLPVGLLAGTAVSVALAVRFDDLDRLVQHAASGFAAFGIAVFLALAASYANLGPSRDVFSVDVTVGVGVVAALAVFLVATAMDRRPTR